MDTPARSSRCLLSLPARPSFASRVRCRTGRLVGQINAVFIADHVDDVSASIRFPYPVGGDRVPTYGRAERLDATPGSIPEALNGRGWRRIRNNSVSTNPRQSDLPRCVAVRLFRTAEILFLGLELEIRFSSQRRVPRQLHHIPYPRIQAAAPAVGVDSSSKPNKI
jgi:hypothetical protein